MMNGTVQHLSYSSASTLLRCPRQWKFRYVDKLPSSLSGQLVAGTVYHKGLAWLFSRKMVGVIPDKEERQDITSSFWEEELSSGKIADEISSVEVEKVFWGWKNNRATMKQKVMTMVDVYATTWLPKYKPKAVEKKYTKLLSCGVELLGYVDVVAERLFDSHDIIADHKWRGKAQPAIALNNDFQSTTYTILTGLEDTEFHEATAGAMLQLSVRPVHRSSDDCKWVEGLYADVWQQIQKGVFPPNPTGFLCSPTYCPYYSVCRLGW